MKRFALCSVFLLLIQISFVGCSDSKETDEPLPPPENTYLMVLANPPEFTAGGGEGNLLFSTDEAWVISFDVEEGVAGDWYAADPLSGNAGQRIAVRVKLSANEEYDPRSVTLVVRTQYLERRIPVTQHQKNAILFDDTNRYELDFEEQTLTVRVRANVDYRVKIAGGAEWIAEAPQSRGLEQHTHTFRIARNGLDDPRTGRILFEDKASDFCDELTVVQAPWDDPDPDRTALNAIFEATGGAGWTNRTNWGSDKPLGEWYGVETDDEGHVVSLRLPHNNLTGTLVPKMGRLPYLRHLDLSRNDLGGELTREAGGEIVSDLDRLTELETLDLSHNRFTGQHMPAKWGAMEHLRMVDLSSNQLQGDAFPEAWNVFFENGRTVDLILNDNALTGEVPAVIQNHPDWNRLALQFIRQKADDLTTGFSYDKAIYLPDLRYTDLKSGSQQQIRTVVGANKLTMLCNWDPTEEESLRFMEQVVRRYRTLYGAQGFEVVALVREGDRYREAAERYVQEHDVPWIAANGCTDAQGRRVVLPDYPYPSYLLVNQSGKLIADMFRGKRGAGWFPERDNSLISLEHSKYMNKTCDDFFGFNNCTYQSTDFSKSKKFETLQKATKGRGIDLILMGDGFTDVDIDTGFYREVMDFAMEAFFKLEPLKSCRHYFNVYMVYAVSKERTVGEYGKNKNTALRVKVSNDNYWFDTNDAAWIVPDYCRVCPLVSDKDRVSTVIVFGAERGLTRVQLRSSGPNYAFTGFKNQNGLKAAENTFIHESVGHAFGLLADEYTNLSYEPIPESEKRELLETQKYGLNLNVSVTSDPTKVPWAHLIDLAKYPYVGIYEGGNYYSVGVWRSEKVSIMDNSSYHYFNAISRELLYKRIITLAGEAYSFEKFLAIDSDAGRLDGRQPTSERLSDREFNDRHVPPLYID